MGVYVGTSITISNCVGVKSCLEAKEAEEHCSE